MNYKRIERLYRLEGLAVPRRKRKRLAVPRVSRPKATVPNDTWGIDFVRDQLASGCRIRCGTPVDGCTRATLKITVNHSLPSVAVIAALDAVIAALDAVIATRGQPVRLSRDNGSECGSRALDAWAADRGIAPAFIQSGCRFTTHTSNHSMAAFGTNATTSTTSSASRTPASTSNAGAERTTRSALMKPGTPSPRASARVPSNPHPWSDSRPIGGERTGGPTT